MTSTEHPHSSSHPPYDLRPLERAYQEAIAYLEGLAHRPVGVPVPSATLRESLDVPLPQEPADAEKVLGDLVRHVDPGLVASAGPRYFGFILGGALPVALAADWMTSAWDQNAFGYVASPAAAVVEEVAARWLLELLRLPARAGVGFVTGGQMANFTGLAAARDEVLRRAGWNLVEDGLAEAPPITVVVGDEAHATIYSALRMLGIGARQIRRVPVDHAGRMRPSELSAVLEGCTGPLVACCQLGNVNTGAFDPVAAIVDAVHERGGWVHADGTFGLWAAAHERYRGLVEGCEKADSWSVDGHKWLNVPYDSGFAIVADPDAHRRALATTSAHYLLRGADDEARHSSDWVPESSRRARAFPVYAALRALGRSGVAEMVDRCCTLARLFGDRLRVVKGVSILNDVVLNQVLLRFAAPGALDASRELASQEHGDDLAGGDAMTLDVVARIQREGTCWAGSTRWQGRAAMRIAISNWSTTEADIERSVASIVSAYAAAIGTR